MINREKSKKITKLLTAGWMQELDAEAIQDIGIPSIVLMENASRGAAAYFAEEFPLGKYQGVIVVAGKGNNGGDGIAIGRILHGYGYRVEILLLAPPEKLNPDPAINFKIIEKLNIPYTIIDDVQGLNTILSNDQFRASGTFIVDAIFGTGISKPVSKGFYGDVIETINDSGFPVAAVDIPSGLSESFLPSAGHHVCADVTATFQCLKIAHIYPDGNRYCGNIRIIDIGIPPQLEADDKYYMQLITPGQFQHLFHPRTIDAHKGNFGHTLTISGSLEKPGAGILSSFAVLKAGGGLCTTALCFENRTVPVAAHPELMTLIYEKNQDIISRLDQFNVILAGPGLGNSQETSEIVSLLLAKATVPLVLDADALNVLQGKQDILKQKRTSPVIITPHPAEFSRISGLGMKKILANRFQVSRDFACEYNVNVILKGHHTIIAAPSGRVYVNQTGNPGMATAGSGDVLCGMVAGMVAQYSQDHDNDRILETICQAAVFLHGYAADLAVKKYGEVSLTASDIIEHIPPAIMNLDEYRSPFQNSFC